MEYYIILLYKFKIESKQFTLIGISNYLFVKDVIRN